jgi:hypothetical protein
MSICEDEQQESCKVLISKELYYYCMHMYANYSNTSKSFERFLTDSIESISLDSFPIAFRLDRSEPSFDDKHDSNPLNVVSLLSKGFSLDREEMRTLNVSSEVGRCLNVAAHIYHVLFGFPVISVDGQVKTQPFIDGLMIKTLIEGVAASDDSTVRNTIYDMYKYLGSKYYMIIVSISKGSDIHDLCDVDDHREFLKDNLDLEVPAWIGKEKGIIFKKMDICIDPMFVLLNSFRRSEIVN